MDRPIHRLLHLVFALGLAHALFLLLQEGVRAYALAQEARRLEEEVALLEARVARLRLEAEAMKDPLSLEALARRAGWVGKEEELRRR